MADIAKLVEDLSQLTVMEAAELAKALEEAWGVSAAAAVAWGTAVDPGRPGHRDGVAPRHPGHGGHLQRVAIDRLLDPHPPRLIDAQPPANLGRPVLQALVRLEEVLDLEQPVLFDVRSQKQITVESRLLLS